MGLTGKVAIVAGGASGIGAAIALLVYIDDATGKLLVRRIREHVRLSACDEGPSGQSQRRVQREAIRILQPRIVIFEQYGL
uniref:Uncharacterized protein n=1 Tax=Rhizobium leguminosarum TaxID=384 RepID=A0A179BQ44_RHILE|nr:hypothetical protein A4U53_23660 [Rhizobium leguminosarum]